MLSPRITYTWRDLYTTKHPDSHKLSQHLGVFPDELIIEPFAVRVLLGQSDLFLLCSDGLTDCLIDDEIALSLRQSPSLREKAEGLFAAVMDAGAKDNVSILLIHAMREGQL